jgi:hypothetical protein
MTLLYSLDDDWLGTAELILYDICKGFLVEIVDAISDPPLLLVKAFFKNYEAAEVEDELFYVYFIFTFNFKNLKQFNYKFQIIYSVNNKKN